MLNTVTTYAEASFYDGAHFAHCAAWDENRRLGRVRKDAGAAFDRRKGSRGIHA